MNCTPLTTAEIPGVAGNCIPVLRPEPAPFSRNNAILDIKSPDFDYSTLYDTVKLNSYQFRLKGRVAKFLPIGRQATAAITGQYCLGAKSEPLS